MDANRQNTRRPNEGSGSVKEEGFGKAHCSLVRVREESKKGSGELGIRLLFWIRPLELGVDEIQKRKLRALPAPNPFRLGF